MVYYEGCLKNLDVKLLLCQKSNSQNSALQITRKNEKHIMNVTFMEMFTFYKKCFCKWQSSINEVIL